MAKCSPLGRGEKRLLTALTELQDKTSPAFGGSDERDHPAQSNNRTCDGDPINSEHAIDSLPTKYICAECGKSHESGNDLVDHYIKHHSWKPITCPYDGCGRRFRFAQGLPLHYSRCHSTAEILSQQSSTEKCLQKYKCNDCKKQYLKENHLAAHHRLAHQPNRWANVDPDIQCDDCIPSSQPTGDTQTQKKRIGLARDEEMKDADPAGDEVISDHEEDKPNEEEKYCIHVTDSGKVIIKGFNDDELEDDELLQADAREEAVFSWIEDVGFLLPRRDPILTLLEEPVLTVDEEYYNYPELAALEIEERPLWDADEDVVQKFAHQSLGPRISQSIIDLLGVNTVVSVHEIHDLWFDAMTKEQRIQIHLHLYEIDVLADAEAIYSSLRSSVLTPIIQAWAAFKILATHLPPRLRASPHSWARHILLSVLRYCQDLEELRDRGFCDQNTPNLEHIPFILLVPPKREFHHYTPIPQLLDGLADRISCKVNHDQLLQLTCSMALYGMIDYVHLLRTQVKMLYSDEIQSTKEWRATFGEPVPDGWVEDWSTTAA